mmetsp:Transcript_28776/g.35098  ORF Transcript_28776/g.35098 Transcript_28776/m.35098 type:complete len:220 (-) Transcript_28776:1819-2478(-)
MIRFVYLFARFLTSPQGRSILVYVYRVLQLAAWFPSASLAAQCSSASFRMSLHACGESKSITKIFLSSSSIVTFLPCDIKTGSLDDDSRNCNGCACAPRGPLLKQLRFALDVVGNVFNESCCAALNFIFLCCSRVLRVVIPDFAIVRPLLALIDSAPPLATLATSLSFILPPPSFDASSLSFELCNKSFEFERSVTIPPWLSALSKEEHGLTVLGCCSD